MRWRKQRAAPYDREDAVEDMKAGFRVAIEAVLAEHVPTDAEARAMRDAIRRLPPVSRVGDDTEETT